MKKYNNNSKHVKDWTTAKLKKEAQSLFTSISVVECFSTSDLTLCNQIESELFKRGYEFTVNKTLSITKED